MGDDKYPAGKQWLNHVAVAGLNKERLWIENLREWRLAAGPRGGRTLLGTRPGFRTGEEGRLQTKGEHAQAAQQQHNHTTPDSNNNSNTGVARCKLA